MLQKDKSITTLSRSSTNSTSSHRFSTPSGVETPIQFVKGVGPRLGSIFSARSIHTVRDILYFFPRSYEDRSQLLTVSELVEGVQSTVAVQIQSQRQIPIRKLNKTLLEVRCSDHTGTLFLKWFNIPRGMAQRFISGTKILVTGKVKYYQSRPEIIHPEITWGATSDTILDEGLPHAGRVVPIYTEIEGISTRVLRKVIWEALEKYESHILEDLPTYLLERRNLPRINEAIKDLHFPIESENFDLEKYANLNSHSHHRMIYDEFFKFEYLMLRRKLNYGNTMAPVLCLQEKVTELSKWQKLLPFQLTNSQRHVVGEILESFEMSYPMNRLVQGDVGSGKTAVAFLTAAMAISSGWQVALMAPTEILAEQHFKNALKLFQGLLPISLLTGKSSAAERAKLQAQLSSEIPLLVIGTHALIEDSVHFTKLYYVIIDEQHRFGVEQRRKLREKGVFQDKSNGHQVVPHCLIMTATPIPRTLALTAFGDLSVSTISELPPGRSPVITKVVRDVTQRKKAFEVIREEIKQGRQAYFIYPLVNDSEAEGFTHLKSAVAEAEFLANEIFPEYRVGLLHGQMRSDEKDEIMTAFQKQEIQILVSTTVIEVGVDVPNATIMVVEHSERFGLSQLHQLRGRVGRGKQQSYCYLFTQSQKEGMTANRLEVLEGTSDGFQIAEADLEIRGPGEFLGTRQAGGLPFKFANLVRDKEWLLVARNDALEIMAKDPDLELAEHQMLRSYYEREGHIQFNRLNVS